MLEFKEIVMSNKAKRNLFLTLLNKKQKFILLSILTIGIIALITLAVLRGFYEIDLGTWQYVIVPFWIGLFAVAYLNYKRPANKDQSDN